MIIKLVKGFLAFLNDGRRLLMWFVKSPLAVAVVLCLFFGAFYMAGIAPNQIGGWFKNTAAPAVGKRIDYLKSDAAGMTDFAKKKLVENGVVLKKETPVKKQVRPTEKETTEIEIADIEAFESEMLEMKRPSRAASSSASDEAEAVQARQRQAEDKVAWAQIMQAPPEVDPLADVDESEIVQGVVSVIGADKIKVDGQTLKLAVKIRSGKAGEAYQALKQTADSVTVRCLLPADDAMCFHNNRDITDILRDRLLVY